MSIKFSPTDWLICLLLCLLTFFLTLHGRKIWKWLCNFFKKKRARRALKPKSPADCPLCREGCTHLPDQPGQDIVPWSEKKSRRGRPKTYNSNGYACLNPLCHYFAIADQKVHALVSNGQRGKQEIQYWVNWHNPPKRYIPKKQVDIYLF